MSSNDGKALGYRDLFSERNYMRHFCANVINRFGDSIDALAFAWIVYEITGDASWSALMMMFNVLPTVLLMPLCGVLVERFDKRRVMILTDLGRAVLVGLVVGLYWLGLLQAWMLAASTFLMSCLEALRIPAGLALYPRLVPREKYTVATSFGQSMSSIATILGAAAFGVIVATVGAGGAMVVNAATFLLSALLVRSIRLPKDGKPGTKLTPGVYMAELKEGLAYLRSRRVIFTICLLGSLLGVLLTPLNALLTPYVQESLHLGSMALSTVNVAITVGTLAGSALFPVINRRMKKEPLFVLGGIASGVAYFGYVLAAHIGPAWLVYGTLAAVSAVLVGFGGAMIQVSLNVAFMEQVSPAYMGRVGAIFNAMANALAPLGSLLVAGLATRLSVVQIFALAGVGMVLLFAVVGAKRVLRAFDTPPENVEGKVEDVYVADL